MLNNYADQMLKLMDNAHLKEMIQATQNFRGAVKADDATLAWSTIDEVDHHLQLLQSDVDMFYRLYEGLKSAMPARRPAIEQSGEVKREEEGYVAPSAETATQATNQVEQQIQLTTFSDDKAVIEERMVSQSNLSGGSVAQHSDAMDHSVVSFLQRPQLVGETVWNPGGNDDKSKRGTILFDFSVPNMTFTKMVINKLDGFTTFRATAVIRLQVNTQPFQCGRLIMAAIPMPSLIQPRDQYMMKHPSLLQAVNHVQMDISKQTEVTLRIPFVSPFNAYDLIHNQYPWARLVVMVYSPLNVVEQVPLEVLLWASFEDVDLGTPTSALSYLATEQSGIVANLAGNALSSLTRGQEQGGEDSGGLGGLIKSGTNIASGIGSLLGFSKPVNPEKGSSVFVRPSHAFGNVDSNDPSHVLSLEINNVVDEYPGLGGTSADEMSLDFIKRVPQYVKSFSYSTSSSYGTPLFQTFLAPTYYLPTTTNEINTRQPDTDPLPGDTISIIQPTALHYAISPFMYWTGSLVYTFRFVKTDFHSGRVEVSFHPFANIYAPGRVDYTYRVVADLREKTELSVTVPYVSPTPWKVIAGIDPLNPFNWNQAGPYATGILVVRALTPLITASSIVSKDIECLVEVRGGSDFRISSPNRTRYFPIDLLTKQDPPALPVPTEQAGEVFAIPGTQETRESALEGFLPQSITGNEADIQQEDTQKICAGETFENYRALTRRFAWVDYDDLDKREVWNIRPSTYIKPPLLRVRYALFEGGGFAYAKRMFFLTGHSPLSFVAGMYTFYRGGSRIKVYSDRDVELISARIVDANSYDPAEIQTTVKREFYPYMSPAGFEMPRMKRFAEFQIPYYSPTMVSVHWDSEVIDPFDQPMTSVDICTNDTNSEQPLTLRLAFGAADDLNFFSFLGAPLCIDKTEVTALLDTNHGKKEKFSRMVSDPAYPDRPERDLSDSYVESYYVTIDMVKFEPDGWPSVQIPKPGKRVHRDASPLELRSWFGRSDRTN